MAENMVWTGEYFVKQSYKLISTIKQSCSQHRSATYPSTSSIFTFTSLILLLLLLFLLALHAHLLLGLNLMFGYQLGQVGHILVSL